jgi:hypothetical protein
MPLGEPKNTWRDCNWTHQLPVYANYVNLWGETIKLYSVVGKDVSLDGNAQKAKHTFISSSPKCRTKSQRNNSWLGLLVCGNVHLARRITNALSSWKGHRIIRGAFRPLCSCTILRGINTPEQGSNPDGGKIIRTRPDPPWGPPSLLYNGYWVPFPAVKRLGRGVDHPPLSSAEVKEIVELYLYSPSGPSWPVIG